MKFIPFTMVIILIGFNIVDSSYVQAQALSGFVKSESILSDKRLQKKITLASERILLYDLIQKMSAQTGVSLKLDSSQRASSTPICIHVHDMELANLMNCISSLLSYQQVQFRWITEVKNDSPTYQLDTAGYDGINTKMLAESRDLFRQQLILLKKMASLKPEERLAYKSDFARSMIDDNNEAASSNLVSNKLNNANWNSLLYFFQLTKDSDWDGNLQGNPMFIPIDSVPDNIRAGILAQLPNGILTNEKGQVVDNPLKGVEFRYMERIEGRKVLMPQIRMGMKRAHGENSINIVGRTGRGLKNRIQKSWLFPGETHHSKLEEISADKYDDKMGARYSFAHRLEKELLIAAQCTQTNFLSLLPENARDLGIYPKNKNIGMIVDALYSENSDMISKWRGETLLLNYPEWFYGDDALFPASLLIAAQLDKHKNGFISLPALIEFSTHLNAEQKKRASEEYTELIQSQEFEKLGLIYKQFPRIYSNGGILVEPDIEHSLLNTSMSLKNEPHDRSLQIRLRDIKTKENGREEYALIYQVKEGLGGWKTLQTYVRRERISPAEAERRFQKRFPQFSNPQ